MPTLPLGIDYQQITSPSPEPSYYLRHKMKEMRKVLREGNN
jgi:hypothetical protein